MYGDMVWNPEKKVEKMEEWARSMDYIIRNPDGEIYVDATNKRKVKDIKNSGLSPIMYRSGTLFYRHITTDDSGILQVKYSPEKPEEMVHYEGEFVNRSTTEKVLGKSTLTIEKMLASGTLEYAGNRTNNVVPIDVDSVMQVLQGYK